MLQLTGYNDSEITAIGFQSVQLHHSSSPKHVYTTKRFITTRMINKYRQENRHGQSRISSQINMVTDINWNRRTLSNGRVGVCPLSQSTSIYVKFEVQSIFTLPPCTEILPALKFETTSEVCSTEIFYNYFLFCMFCQKIGLEFMGKRINHNIYCQIRVVTFSIIL